MTDTAAAEFGIPIENATPIVLKTHEHYEPVAAHVFALGGGASGHRLPATGGRQQDDATRTR